LRIGTLPGSRAVAPVRGYDPATLIATWFGTGLLPVAPGTWGSLVAVPLGWGIAAVGGRVGLAVAAVIVFALGVWAAGVVIRRTGAEDPPQVGVDEVVGQWLALLAAPDQPLLIIAGFVLFRLFDIAKPWPVSWADRTQPC